MLQDQGRFPASPTLDGVLVLYAIAIVYVSTVLGPDGFNFTPMSLGDAWRAFLGTRYVPLGSDQRSDWNGNLAMFVPLGCLAAHALRRRFAGQPSWLANLSAFLACLAFLLVVKFAQLFFPPRTVTLNYILAQSTGTVVGICLYALLRSRPMARVLALLGRRRFAIDLGLRAYLVFFIALSLFPFNLALSGADLRERFATLAPDLMAWPLSDRPLSQRLLYVVVTAASAVPIGLLLRRSARDRSLASAMVRGAALIGALFAAQIFIISATPHLLTAAYRIAGLGLGVVLPPSFRIEAVVLRKRARQLLPIAVPLYLAAVVLVNDLAAREWRSLPEAVAALELPGLLPFWHHYIVSKAQAMQSVVLHAAMYAPIGVIVWLHRDGRRGGALTAATLAFILAVAVELARWFRPGLQPDFSNALIAAAAAAIAVAGSRVISRLFAEQSDGSGEPSRLPAPRPVG